MRFRKGLLLLLVILIPIGISGQAEISNSRPYPATVRAAELEGSTFPHGEPVSSPGPGFNEKETEGTANRICVEFPDGIGIASRRSGEIIVGAEIGALNAGKEGKVWWAPLHDPASNKTTLLVRSVRLDRPEVTSRFTSTDYAFPMSGWTVIRDHGFFPSAFSLPSSGKWLLTVTSGNDWGCFIVSVH
jgi:hypothetical protein